jgi:hypothetical protein
MHFWSYVSQIIMGKEQADLWWVVDGNRVVSFLIMKVYQDFDGKWTAFIQFGYSRLTGGCDQFKIILEDYKHKGITRFQFTTIRNPKVFKRWLGQNWESIGTLFQARY